MFNDDFFNEAFQALSGEEFDERPVDIRTFVESEDWLSAGDDKVRLSEYQYQLVEAMTQIFYEDTLIYLYGEKEGTRRWQNETFREIVMQLGKGSGKDFTSTIAVAYVVYLCMCLKNPTKYFKNASIDIINVAINADQAQRVFFANFMHHIRIIPFFQGKYDDKRDSVNFDKKINVYSGHSEREAYEGYNTFMIILDEISGFALENTSGNHKAKTGEEIYNWARGSVTSRFSETGKIVLLSFPRFKDDFIQQKYKDVIYGEKDEWGNRPMIGDVETIERRKTVKANANLPDGTEGNEFEIVWEEDHILRYAYPYTFALKRPSWEVNPNKELQKDYALDFYRNPGDAYGRFACMPSNLEDGYFKNMDKVKEAFCLKNGVDEAGVFMNDFLPEQGKKYFLHVDLAQKHDHAAVAMAHVEKWVKVGIGSDAFKVDHPVVKVDVIRYWTPRKDKTIDFADIRDFIVALRNRGFDIKLCTFDRWNSHDTMNILTREHGIKTELLSVAEKHYNDFLSTVYDSRLVGPQIELLTKELGELRLIKNKVDHPAKGSKDLSDAVCGAIFNASAHTVKPQSEIVEILDYREVLKREHLERVRKAKAAAEEKPKFDGVIRAPQRKRDMDPELREYLTRFKILG